MLRAASANVGESFPMPVEMEVVTGERRAIYQAELRGVPSMLVVLTARREVALRRLTERDADPSWLPKFEAIYDSVPWEATPDATPSSSPPYQSSGSSLSFPRKW